MMWLGYTPNYFTSKFAMLARSDHLIFGFLDDLKACHYLISDVAKPKSLILDAYLMRTGSILEAYWFHPFRKMSELPTSLSDAID